MACDYPASKESFAGGRPRRRGPRRPRRRSENQRRWAWGCGGGRNRTGGAEGSGGADNRADVAGILHASEDDKKRRAGGRRGAQEVVERGGARLHESGDALGMFGVGETFEKAIRGAE